jgi:hypothetical protein
MCGIYGGERERDYVRKLHSMWVKGKFLGSFREHEWLMGKENSPN